MFVFRLVKWIAFLGLILGLLRVGLALFIAFGTDDRESIELAASRYLGTATSGEAIDRGIEAILVALAFWMLARIGQHVTAIGP
jgi:hypothetical protein